MKTGSRFAHVLEKGSGKFIYLSLCVCLCLCAVPSTPADLLYVNSTESTMTLSWKQSGVVDRYIVQSNDTDQSLSVNVSSVSVTVTVTVTVSDLLTPGALYCISVTAVSTHLYSDTVTLCNHTGDTSLNRVCHVWCSGYVKDTTVQDGVHNPVRHHNINKRLIYVTCFIIINCSSYPESLQ